MSRHWRRPVAVLATVSALLLASVHAVPAQTAPAAVKGEINLSLAGGYTRLVVHLQRDIDAQVRVSNNVLIISFAQPVDVAVDRVTAAGSEFIGAARRDPDGRAIRLALTRKVRVNTMPAGERLFVDLLPETWSGVLPGLPQDVVADLARRAREAERLLQENKIAEQQRAQPPIRVRVARLPTLTRFIFRLPDKVGVASAREAETLTLTFDAPLKYDLADALVDLPKTVKGIESKPTADSVVVRFTFTGKSDLRTFREDSNYVVDVVTPEHAAAGGVAPAVFEGIGRLDESRALPQEPTKDAASSPPPHAPQVVPPNPPQPVTQTPASPAASLAGAPQIAPPSQVPPDAAAPRQAQVQAEAPRPQPVPAKTEAPPTPAVQTTDRAAVSESAGAVKVNRQGETLTVDFPFAAPTPAAVFRRADTIWLVFDATRDLDLTALRNDPSRTVRSVETMTLPHGRAVRVKLERPRLATMSATPTGWSLTISGVITTPAQPLTLTRNVAGAAGSNLVIPFDAPNRVHRLVDPDIGDELLVVSALGPARAIVKAQDFAELNALATAHGVVIQPLADDVGVELSADKITVTRPGGLSLSASTDRGRQVRLGAPAGLSAQQWDFDRRAPFAARQSELQNSAADASPVMRLTARMKLARFYLARDLAQESKAVLDVAISDERITAENAGVLVLHAVACAVGGRPDLALQDLANPLVADHAEARLWRGVAHARQGRWSDARDEFRASVLAIGALPVTLQRDVLIDAARAFVEANDFSGAATRLSELDTIGVSDDEHTEVSVLVGRLAEGLGRREEALSAYRAAADGRDKPAAAQARLREIALRYQIGDLPRNEALGDLERLTTAWRGDQTEAEALALLSHLYMLEDRYRDAFYTVRAAIKAHPNSEMTRRMHDEALDTFGQLFLSAKGADLPVVESLGLFYDFRDLTPTGRRGDEMIRRLADRLVSIDLLDQAGELLQYQIDNRLQGAARSQIAARLAVIYLMNRKPGKALTALRTSRGAELSSELRNQRMLIEARALSDTGRHDLALEVIANLKGRAPTKLRADIQWAAQHWNAAGEQLELLLGDRWNSFAPLTDIERTDVLRAAVAFALAGDRIGLSRLQERYAVKMASGPDRRAFEVATTMPVAATGPFAEVTQRAAGVDTLDGFLREMRDRYPEVGPMAAQGERSKASAKASPAVVPSATGVSASARPQRQAAAR